MVASKQVRPRSSERTWVIALNCICLAAVALATAGYLSFRVTDKSEPLTSLHHFIGGFSMVSSAMVGDAANDGVQVDLLYGGPPSPSSEVGQALDAHQMRVIDGVLWMYIEFYECHRLHTCSETILPELTSAQAVLQAVTVHLQQMRNNPLILGYWMLDDWPRSDPGSARDLLVQIHRLIHQYTPGRPAICGFAGALEPLHSAKIGWNDKTARAFPNLQGRVG
jgi:hypothetical protein